MRHRKSNAVHGETLYRPPNPSAFLMARSAYRLCVPDNRRVTPAAARPRAFVNRLASSTSREAL